MHSLPETSLLGIVKIHGPFDIHDASSTRSDLSVKVSNQSLNPYGVSLVQEERLNNERVLHLFEDGLETGWQRSGDLRNENPGAFSQVDRHRTLEVASSDRCVPCAHQLDGYDVYLVALARRRTEP